LAEKASVSDGISHVGISLRADQVTVRAPIAQGTVHRNTKTDKGDDLRGIRMALTKDTFSQSDKPRIKEGCLD
jgi:hypothetical protein